MLQQKLREKGRIKLEKHEKAIDALLVQGIKQNILSVGQIANKEHIIVFTSTKCQILDEEIGKVIARGYKNLDKLYVLAEKNSGRNKRYSSSSSSDSE